jgi:hypothetical protein
MEQEDPSEQLRRLKNTLMGAGHRLALLARSGVLDADEAAAVAQVAGEAAQAAQRLERLLALRRTRA